MSIPMLFLLYPAVCWMVGVGALPATATVTLFEATPTVESVSAVSGATSEIDVSILGVSSGSAGTETTYSIGIYQSMPANTATESGSLVTVVPTTVHGVAVTQNYTLVESSGGYWASFSAFASGTVTSDGIYQTCTFDANGGPSASCRYIEYVPTVSSGLATATVSHLDASKVPLAVVTATSMGSSTSSSNAAMSTSQGSYWKMGIYASFFCVLVVLIA
ncbi:hypothetical protein BT96DRAFT_920207 [Gymnopus androsaceus JB14]|uniref:Uncharacterized protein n=1 Tax=Gymnopus androsaceus JB14 TaxID=1447944 RepID=A0A6A4HN36_9AGAR|nr:hypothetical protein BT96DRAFT_920207 [Gymnopus androsaceus JB14]